ncbi:recombinase family protein [Spirulina subsalsa FACHB-351]|uniref:Recombinase family protein n=2 Tax=Spirulina subsalsa TaxID=54311 RepID=A0ABT3L6F9_9CYAN|nr:recombinase family protein [Spirulina subsalsa FACHB-351]
MAMRIVAYLYSNLLLETPPEEEIWGLEVDQVYQDVGMGESRPQLESLLEESGINPPDYLLVRRLAELGEDLESVGRAIALLESYGVEIIVTEDVYTTSSPPPKAALLQLLAHLQREQRSRRLRQGHARNRLQALPPPGKAPYGYRRGKDRYILDRSTAPVVKDFFERFLLFGSLRGAVRYLEKKYGKKIAVSTGRRWLTHPVYRGDTAYRNGEIIPQTHTPLISSEEAAQIDRLLRRNRPLAPRSASAPRSLAGLVFCSHCQSPTTITRVTSRGKSSEYLYLRPLHCPQHPKCKAFPYQEILKFTIQRICQDLPAAIAAAQSTAPPSPKAAIQGDIARKEEILAQLTQLEATGILDRDTANWRRYQLRNEIAQHQAQLAQLPPENLQNIAQAVSLPQFWLDLSEAERRFYFREFLEQIEVVRGENGAWEVELLFIFRRIP